MEKQTASFIGIQKVPELGDAFQTSGGQRFSGKDWLHHIDEGSSETSLQYRENSKSVLLYFRVIQGHTGGAMIAHELMGHVASPYKSGRNSCSIEDVRTTCDRS